MNKDNVDVQDYLDDMADSFLDGIGTSEEFARVQALISQAFCFGIDRQQQTIKSLKAQLAQYQSDDYLLVNKQMIRQLVNELDHRFSKDELLGITDLIALRDGFSLLVDDGAEAQEQYNG